jgi:hypothetical protein
MMKIIKLISIVTLVIITILACSKEDSGQVVEPENPDLPAKETHHPFLIVKKDMYPALREKSSQEPWKSMKADAIKRSNAGSTNDEYKLQEYIGAAALAYILDESNAQTHANRIRDAILNKYSTIDVKDSGDWGGVVPPMSTFFVAILALDIVYDALTLEEIQACENIIENQIFKISRKGSWVDARYGTHGTWDIYKGDRTTPDNEYYAGIMQQITPDGVSPVTNHYAWERVGGGNSRISKSGYMDALEFTGIDKRYYNNEQIQKFQRWLFGSSVNCAKEMAIFGDMLPTQGISNDMLHRRVVNFDMEAAGYAAWFHEGRPAYGHILTYIIPKQALPEPVVPTSKFYENGGAFLREKEDDPNGLHAVLYNIKTQDEWHTHNEVNGLALSGLGNRLLVNGGRLGEPTREAKLNNTLTINGNNHDSRVGGGIVEGFTSNLFDFSVGFSGPAFSGKSHKRNIILVHGADDAKGYFILFDEVEASSGDQIKNYLHPANQTNVDVTNPLAEYSAKIDHYPTVNGTSMCFYYLTPPNEVNLEKSQSAVPERYPGYPEHNRLEAVYNTNSEGSKNMATLLLPYSFGSPKAAIQNAASDGFNACVVSQNGVNDYIFETMLGNEYVSNDITFNAELSLVRKTQASVPFYFVRNGTKLSVQNLGFESDGPATIYCRDNTGTIISDGVKIKLVGVGIENIQFSPAVEIINSGTDFIEVNLTEGTFTFN